METETRLKSAPESFWKSVFSDLQETGLFHSHSPQKPDRAGKFNAQVHIPLTPREPIHPQARTETVLRAAWAVVLARHTSSNDVIFFSSFHDEQPWLAPLRVVLPTRRPVSEWLIEFERELRKTEENGPTPEAIMAQVGKEGLDRTLPTFVIIPPGASAFPPRDQIRGPLLVLARLDISMIEIHYDSAWFDQTEVEALGYHLNVVLKGMASSPQCAVGNLPLLTERERHKLLDEWNDTTVPFAENTCVHEFFKESAQHVRPGEKQVPIGRLAANIQFYILDPARELVPIGSVGELYIGGAGLAREYLHRPGLTQERFVTREFSPGKPERLYRTGDLVRYTRDGRLEFTGRIELGKTGTVLSEPPAVREADDKPEIFLLGARFEEQAARYPDAPALTLNGASLSYRDLNARANRLAAHLRHLGIGPESLVGIHLDRSFELVVGIFAILKAGGAYLPLDLACPEDRLSFMMEDSESQVLLTDSSLASHFTHYPGTLVCLDKIDLTGYSPANVATAVRPEQLAYVIYTSGSTGQPKGVLVTHENVARLFTATDDWFHFGPRDVWTLFHSYAFDFSVWEIFGALLYGGRLVIVPYEVSRSAEAFHDLLVREKVTVLNQTPSAFRQLVQADQKGPKANLVLRYIIFGGEALEFQSLAPWFERYGDQVPKCINMYGITETTVHVTYRPVTQQDVAAGSGSNIGLPIPDLQIYVVNGEGVRVKPGEEGEILVGGKGVARGYLKRPELTEERFIPNTFDPGLSPRLYRTGDSARCLANGELEYLGRIDQQVKIRGFRIELTEIESVLARYPGVRECAVIARAEPGGDPRLLAYIVADPQNIPPVEALRTHLGQKLPTYMVPAVYVFMDSFPLTLNGKLDRNKLPAPSVERPLLAAEFVAPQGELEENLARLWCRALGLEAVGTNDNFFDLGGDSLSAMNMMAQVEKLVGRTIGIRPLLKGGTIKDITAAVRDIGPVVQLPLMICMQAGDSKPPFFFAHGDYICGGLYCQKMAQKLGPDQPLYALAPHGTFGGDLFSTFEEIAASYIDSIRSVQPKGPYYLGGYCNGAVAMYEVAQQLRKAGEIVRTLILLDPPDFYLFLLRQRITRVGKLLGMSEHKSRNIFQRIAEGIEVWKDQGLLRLVGEFWARGIRWMTKRFTNLLQIQNSDTSSKPNLNFHYYEVMAHYEPLAYPESWPVWIILREGERGRHSQQFSYWNGLIPDTRFEVVPGSHLDLMNSMDGIAHVIRKALDRAAPGK